MPAPSKPSPLTQRRKQITKLIDWYCDSQLNEEYRDVCRIMAKHFCVKASPALKGKASSWAAGIVAAVGYVNFLHDPQQVPHVTKRELAKTFGVTVPEVNKHLEVLIDGFDLIPFDPDYSLPSRINLHSAIWDAATTGVRFEELSSKLQREALKQLLEEQKRLMAEEGAECCGAVCCSDDEISCGDVDGGCGAVDCCQSQGEESSPANPTPKRTKRK